MTLNEQQTAMLDEMLDIAEEITLEAIQIRATPLRDRVGGQSSSSNHNLHFLFSVLFDDVVVSVDISGMTAEQVWKMLQR